MDELRDSASPTKLYLYNDIMKSELRGLSSLDFSGWALIDLPTPKCKDARFFCITVQPKSGGYIDPNLKNNGLCEGIRENLACAIDIKVSNFTHYPGSTDNPDPMIGSDGQNNVIDLTVENVAANEAGNHIPAEDTSQDRKNFKFTAYYATDADVKVALNFDPVFSKTDLQKGLAGGDSFTIKGDIVYPAISESDCEKIKRICVRVDTIGNFLETAANQLNNTLCQNISITCYPDPAPHSLSPTGLALVGGSVNTITFDVGVRNDGTTPGADDIPQLSSSSTRTHFKMLLQLCENDISTSIDQLGMPLGQALVSDTDNKQKITAGGGSVTFTGGTVDLQLPLSKCERVNFVCLILMANDNSVYKDKSKSREKNSTCTSVLSNQKTCEIDVLVSKFDITTGNIIFPMSPRTVIFDFSVTIEHGNPSASVPAIAPGNTDDENFEVTFKESDEDVRATGKNLTVAAISATLDSESEAKMALKWDQKADITGRATMGITSTACQNAKYLCVWVQPNGTLAYPDSDLTNNVMCKNIVDLISCSPDLVVRNFTSQPDSSAPMIGTEGASDHPFLLVLENRAGAGNGNGIRVASVGKRNFEITGYYARTPYADNPKHADAVAGYSFDFVNLDSTELRQGIDPGSSVDIGSALGDNGKIRYPAVALSVCRDLNYACVYVNGDTTKGATFLDSNTTNNYLCKVIVRTCRPDVKPRALNTTDLLEAGVATSVSFSLAIDNVATGAENDVVAVTSGVHFEVELQFSDVNMSTQSNSLASPRVSTIISDAELRVAIPAGQSVNIGVSPKGSATLTVDEALCSKTKYLCAVLMKSPTDSFTDASGEKFPKDSRDNSTCLFIVNLVTCHIDVEIIAFSEPDNEVFEIGKTVVIAFSTTVRNNDAFLNIPKVEGVGDENFHFKFYLSDVNLRYSPFSDNLNISAFENVTLTPATAVKNGLLAMGTMEMSGTVTIVVPSSADHCSRTQFLCINTMPGQNGFPEDKSNTSNNIFCKDIASQVSCGVDVVVSSFETVPTESDPLVGPWGKTGVDFRVDIKNQAKAGQGYDIPAATGSRKNFRVTAFYTQNLSNPTALGGVTFAPTLSDEAVQIPLPGVGTGAAAPTSSISGTIDYPPPTDCPNTNGLCVVVDAETPPTYGEAHTDKADNTYCRPIAVTCEPDPAPQNLGTTDHFHAGQWNAVSFTMDLVNKATTGKHHDIFTAAAPNFNFKVELQASDVNLAEPNTVDTLSLPVVTAALSLADRRTNLTASSVKHIAGTASISIPDSGCSKVKWLCASLWAGRGAAFEDASITAGLNGTRANATCLEIIRLMACAPDPMVKKWAVNGSTSPLIFVKEKWQSVSIQFEIENIALGNHSNIRRVDLPFQNFYVTIKFTKTNLEIAPSPINSTDLLYDLTSSTLNEALDAGNTLTFEGKVRAGILSSQCNDLNFLCIIFKHGSYTDENTRNNFKCLDVSRNKACFPDVKFDTLTDNPTTQVIKDSASGTFTFDTTLINVANPLPGNDILSPPLWPNNSNSFKYSLTFSDVDIGSGETDSLGIAAVSASSEYNDILRAQTETVTHTNVSADIMIPAAKCQSVKFLCVNVSEGANAQYVDADKNNNAICINIVGGSTKKNCRPTFQNLPNATTLDENTNSVVNVFTVVATQGDNDVPNALTYTFDVTSSEFEIDNITGIVKTKPPFDFDYEKNDTYTLHVVVTDGTLNDPAYTVTAALTITLTDLNEKPEFTPNNMTVPAVPENTATSVYNVTVMDPDRPPQKMNYWIEVDPVVVPSAPFAIDADGTISVTPPGLNFEAHTPPTYTVTVHVRDNGVPPLTADPRAVVVVPCAHIAEQPSFVNLPNVTTVDEFIENGSEIFRISASDPDDNTTFQFFIVVQPDEGNIVLDGSIVRHKNPPFDYERRDRYDVTVYVKDSKTDIVQSTLRVNIANNTYGESPKFTNWCSPDKIAENVVIETEICQISAYDPDKRPIVFSLTVAPPRGQAKFAIDPRAGRLSSVSNPGFDYETDQSYVAKIKICAYANCTSRTMTINIGDINEPPVCKPTSVTRSVRETGRWSPGKIFDVTDQEGGTITYAVLPGLHSSKFSIAANGDVTGTYFDYDAVPGPQMEAIFSAQDDAGNKCYCKLKVNIIDTNSARPTFDPKNYFGTISESDGQGTSVLTVTAYDADVGDPGVITFSVNAADPNKPNENFEFEKISLKHGILKVKTPMDREGMAGPNTVFEVYAKDPLGRQDVAFVNITVKDVNDHHPKFSESFYSFEINNDAAVGTYVGTVYCTDDDATYNVPSYRWVKDHRSDNFTIDATSGTITTAVSPLQEETRFELLVECLDNYPGDVKVSGSEYNVRIDTYTSWKCLTKWTTSKPISYWDPVKIAGFLNDVSAVCAGQKTVAKLRSFQSDSSGQAVFVLYFREKTTDQKANIAQEKECITASSIIKSCTSGNDNTPSYTVHNHPKVKPHHLVSIERFMDEPEKTNFMLDTEAGHCLMGVFMCGCLILVLTSAVFAVKCVAKNTMKNARLDTPSKPYQERRKPVDRPKKQDNTLRRRKSRSISPQNSLQDLRKEPTTVSISDVEVTNHSHSAHPPAVIVDPGKTAAETKPSPIISYPPGDATRAKAGSPHPRNSLAPSTSSRPPSSLDHSEDNYSTRRTVPKQAVEAPRDTLDEANRNRMQPRTTNWLSQARGDNYGDGLW